jgi:hypothetical protein
VFMVVVFMVVVFMVGCLVLVEGVRGVIWSSDRSGLRNRVQGSSHTHFPGIGLASTGCSKFLKWLMIAAVA